MNEVFFQYSKAETKWLKTDLLPYPPNYTPIRKEYTNSQNNEPHKIKRVMAYCKIHNAWEPVKGILTGTNGKHLFSSSCGSILPPPYINYFSSVPFAYNIRTFSNDNFITFIVYCIYYKNDKKIKTELTFTLSTLTGEIENVEKKFDVDNDKLEIPPELIEYIVMLAGKSFMKDFGFSPTLTSRVHDISVISGYVKYPFNANLCELQKISGMKDFKIARDDSLNENKMYDFLNIKPTKKLRKKYQEYPFAPIAWKFFEGLEFKDSNIFVPYLDNDIVYKFLTFHWVRYDEQSRKIIYSGDDKIAFFVKESMKLNKEKTVLSALLVCLETEDSQTEAEGFSYLMDSISMIQNNFEHIPEDIRKEIFHDGITKRTHDNIVNMLNNMGFREEENPLFGNLFHGIMPDFLSKFGNHVNSYEPFPYSPADLLLEYQEVNAKTGEIELEFSLPKTEKELIEFGRAMHNCVGWGFYTADVRSRKDTIVAVYVNGKADMCLEVKNKSIVQALGVCNKQLNNSQRAIIRDWADRKIIKKGVVY